MDLKLDWLLMLALFATSGSGLCWGESREQDEEIKAKLIAEISSFESSAGYSMGRKYFLGKGPEVIVNILEFLEEQPEHPKAYNAVRAIHLLRQEARPSEEIKRNVRKTYVEILASSHNQQLCEAILGNLELFDARNPNAAPVLCRIVMLKDGKSRDALQNLRRIGDPAIPFLNKLFRDGSDSLRFALKEAYEGCSGEIILSAIEPFLEESNDIYMRYAALRVLAGRLRSEDNEPLAERLLAGQEPYIRCGVALHLFPTCGKEFLLEQLDSPRDSDSLGDVFVRYQALRVLEQGRRNPVLANGVGGGFRNTLEQIEELKVAAEEVSEELIEKWGGRGNTRSYPVEMEWVLSIAHDPLSLLETMMTTTIPRTQSFGSMNSPLSKKYVEMVKWAYEKAVKERALGESRVPREE